MGDDRGFTAADVAWWVPATAAAVALAAGLASVCHDAHTDLAHVLAGR